MEENLEGAALKAVMDAVHTDFAVIGARPPNCGWCAAAAAGRKSTWRRMGRPAHSSTPLLGRNAVLDMLPVIQAIAALPLPSDPFLGPGVLALTDIISDPYPAYSVIPSRCRVTYDRRLLAGETAEAVLGDITGLPGLEGIELRAAIAQGEHQTYTGAFLRGPKFLPAWLLEETDPYVQAALKGLNTAGLDPQFGAYRFCTNAAYSAGTAGVPTIGFGPGREADAHVIDERLAVDDLLAAARGYRGIIEFVMRMPGG